MAEILLVVGDHPVYQDGDVLCAFNRRRTRCVHAQHVCNVRKWGGKPRQLRPLGTVAEEFQRLTYQYRFQRRGDEVVRTDLASMSEVVFGPDKIDVRLFLNHRLRSKNHRIFGHWGGEVWYGGKQTFDNSTLNSVWSKIAEKTDRTESDDEFQLWPMGRMDIREFLAVRTVDFTDAEADALVAPQYDLDADGNPQTDENDNRITLSKRNINVDWRANLLDDLQVTESEVLDRNNPVGVQVSLPVDRIGFRSKSQPTQVERGRLQNKEIGGPVQ